MQEHILNKFYETLERVKRSTVGEARDSHGRWTTGAAGKKPTVKPTGKTGKAIPTTDSQRKLPAIQGEESLGAGKNRDKPRGQVYGVYKDRVALFNPTHTMGTDGGACFSMGWKNGDKPSNYPDGMPHNPRPTKAKLHDFSAANEYKPFADAKTVQSWIHEGDLGAHKARVMMQELYSHARQRQGNIDNLSYAKAKDRGEMLNRANLASFDVDIHHMIPAGMGGSNTGKNLVMLTPSEHIMAHMLEWSIAKQYNKDGSVAQTGKWAGYVRDHGSFKAGGAAIKADNIARTLDMQLARCNGNPDKYFAAKLGKKPPPEVEFTIKSSVSILFKAKVISSSNPRLVKVRKDSVKGWRTAWTTGDKSSAMAKLSKYLETH